MVGSAIKRGKVGELLIWPMISSLRQRWDRSLSGVVAWSAHGVKLGRSALFHQENSNRLARLAPDMPDSTRLPDSVW